MWENKIQNTLTCQITHHVASLQGQHKLVCANKVQEHILSSQKSFALKEIASKLSGEACFSVIWLDFEKKTVTLWAACNRNKYQECLLVGKGNQSVRLTTLPHSHANCLKLLEASTSWGTKGLSRCVQGQLHLHLLSQTGNLNGTPLYHHVIQLCSRWCWGKIWGD